MGLRAGKLDRGRGVNEDREWLEISGDRDCELCAGNKQGRNRYLLRGKRKVCDCGHWGRCLEELLLPKDQKTKGKKERAEWRGKLERV